MRIKKQGGLGQPQKKLGFRVSDIENHRATACRCLTVKRSSLAQVFRVDSVDFFGSHVDRVANLLLRVAGSDEDPQPRSPLFDGWIENRLDVDPAVEQRPRKPQAMN